MPQLNGLLEKLRCPQGISRRVITYGLSLLLFVAAARDLSAQPAERTPAPDKFPVEMTAEEQAFVPTAIAAVVSRDGAGWTEALKRVPKMSTTAATTILSCVFEKGDSQQVYWALTILPERIDLQPILLDHVIRQIDSNEKRPHWISNHFATEVPLAPDAVLALAGFDPSILRDRQPVRESLLRKIKSPLPVESRLPAAAAYWNLFGSDPAALQVLKEGLDVELNSGSPRDDFSRSYNILRSWPAELTPLLIQLASSAKNFDRRQSAMYVLEHHLPSQARLLCREVLANPATDFKVADTAFSILFEKEEDPGPLLHQMLERHRKALVAGAREADESSGFVTDWSPLYSVERRFGFDGMLEFLRKEFDQADSDIKRSGLARLFSRLYSSDEANRAKIVAHCKMLQEDSRLNPEDRTALAQWAELLSRPPLRRGR